MNDIKIDILNNEVYLDSVCWNCKGTGKPEKDSFLDDNGKCDICKGTGYQLSEVGESIIDLVNRHIHGRVDEAVS